MVMVKTTTIYNSQLYLIGDVRNNTLAPVSLAPMTSLALVV